MKYLQADSIFQKSNKISLTSNDAKVDRNGTSSTQPYQAELIIIIIMQIVLLILCTWIVLSVYHWRSDLAPPAKHSNKTSLLCI